MSTTRHRDAKLFAAVGLFAGLAALIAILTLGDTFGYPGSAAYRTYEAFNRGMGALILLMAAPLASFCLQSSPSLPQIDRGLTAILLAAWIGMAAGTAAEFWLFSDLPYSADNLRSASFSLFSFSSLVVGLASLALGIRLLLARQLPWTIPVVFVLILPLDVLLFIAGQSIFLAATLAAIALSVLAFIQAGPSAVHPTTAA